MGDTWVVLAWITDGNGGYRWHKCYRGESLLRAMAAAFTAKRAGAGCVKVEWR
ncbi:MAG: hypothetical protein RJQ08_13530 [Salinisphaeraceae bacterium]